MNRRIAAFLSCLALAGSAAAVASPNDDSYRLGGNVEVSEATTGTLHALGGKITIEAPVHGGLRAAGGTVEVAEDGMIEGDAALAGGEITVSGPIHGDLHIAGGQVTIDAPVSGDVHVASGTLTVGPSARIAGKLKFRGGELDVDEAAVITGGTEFKNRAHRHDHDDESPFTHGWGWSLALVLLAALLAGAFPGPTQRFAQELRARPWQAPLVGLLVLTAIPIAAVLIMVTLIGIPVGLLALVLYAALLLVGYVWLAVVVGGRLLDHYKAETAALVAWRVGAAVLAMAVLAILVRVPFLGGMVKVAALAAGVGMIVGVVMRRVNGPTPLAQ